MSRTPKSLWLAVVRHFGSVRLRSAAVTILIVGIAFTLSAFGVVALLRNSLYEGDANTAQAEALNIASFITTRGQAPTHLPISESEMAAQIVNSSGSVIVSSRNIAGQGAMVDLTMKPGKVTTRTGVLLPIRRFTHVNLHLDFRFVVAAVGFDSSNFIGTVLVANSLGDADHAVGLVEQALEIALPLLALLVGALVWVLTGWALRPVEVIRTEVAELSAKDLHRRVPELAVQDEIGRLAHTMNDMLGRLEASQDRERQLVADVSHELRNPLAALQTQLEVVAEHPGLTSAKFIDDCIAEVTRMTQLVEDLLTLARLDEGMLRLRLTDVDLDELLLVHADRLRARGNVEVSVGGVGAARVRGDEAQLTRVVANLSDNAERYARHSVGFAVVQRDDGFDLSVTDDGPGIPWFERQHVFERLVRLDTARTHGGTGAGLGLAIVREIVSTHGGEVWVEDAEPGARFVVHLRSMDELALIDE